MNKTPEEIEKLADALLKDYLPLNGYKGYIKVFAKGYTQCQADNAETAVKFADWINNNNYEKFHGNRWCMRFMSFTHSTQELYDIYLIKTSLNK